MVQRNAQPTPPTTHQDLVGRFPLPGKAWELVHAGGEEAGPVDERTRRLVKLAVQVGARQTGVAGLPGAPAFPCVGTQDYFCRDRSHPARFRLPRQPLPGAARVTIIGEEPRTGRRRNCGMITNTAHPVPNRDTPRVPKTENRETPCFDRVEEPESELDPPFHGHLDTLYA